MTGKAGRVSQDIYSDDFLPWLLLLSKSLYQSATATLKKVFPNLMTVKKKQAFFRSWFCGVENYVGLSWLVLV